jgi:hypothetical protein
MILEYAQLLSTAHRILDGTESTVLSESGRKKKVWKLPDHRDSVLYSCTHANHPSAIWARQSEQNYRWLFTLFCELLDEYTYRYRKQHATSRLLTALARPPHNIDMDKRFTPPTPAMPDECKVVGDRKYYIDKKADMAKWTNREPPSWFINGVKEKDANVCVPLQELRERFRKVPVNVKPKRTRAVTM